MNDTLRILVVDDDRSLARTLKDIFTVKGFYAETAHSGHEALKKIKKSRFDCLIIDIKMPKMNGVEFYRAVKSVQPDIHAVFMTAYSSDELIKEGLAEGIIAALIKPLDINAILRLFHSLRKECSLVIIDDDPEFCRTLGDILQERDYAVTQITDPHSLLKNPKLECDIVLLDMKLDHISGLDILKKIRKDHPQMPVILITGYREEMMAPIEAAFKINAYTCLYKPFQIEELLTVLTEIRRKEMGKIFG